MTYQGSMEWKFRKKLMTVLGYLVIQILCQATMAEANCGPPPAFPNFFAAFPITIENKIELYEEVKAEVNCSACDIEFMEDGRLDEFNSYWKVDHCEDREELETCIITTVAPTTITTQEDTTTTEPATTTATFTTTVEDTTTVQDATTTVTTSSANGVETTTREGGSGDTTTAAAPPIGVETTTVAVEPPWEPSTGSRPSTNPPVTGGDSDSTTGGATTLPVVPPLPTDKTLPSTGKDEDKTYIYAIAGAAAVFLVVVLVVLVFFCRKRCCACSGAQVLQGKHAKLQQQRSDCLPISAALHDDTYSEPRTPSPQTEVSMGLNGTLGRGNGFISNGQKIHDKPSKGDAKKKDQYLILREDSTHSAYDFQNDAFHFNTLKAMELPHALQHGDFGETSTDFTIPRNKNKTKMAETSLTMDPNCNTFKGSKKKRNGSDSGVEVSPTLQSKVSDTVKSKHAVGYITYDNPCIQQDDDVDGDRKSMQTPDTQSVCTLDSRDAAALKDWEDWVENELCNTPKTQEDQGEDLVNPRNAHLFFPPTPEDSPTITPQNSLDEESPPLSKKPSPAKSDFNANEVHTSYPHVLDVNTLVGSDMYMNRLPSSTPTTTISSTDSSSYKKKLPGNKPVAQIEPMMQNGHLVGSRKPEVVRKLQVEESPPSKTNSDLSLNKVGVVAPPPEFSDDADVFPESPSVVVVQPAKPAVVHSHMPVSEVEEDSECGIKPRRISVRDLKAQFENKGPTDDHQSTLRKYGSKPRSSSTRQEAPAMATLPRGNRIKSFPGKAHVFGKPPLEEVPPGGGQSTGRNNFLWAGKNANGPSA